VAFEVFNVLVLNIAEKLVAGRYPEQALGPISIPQGSRRVVPYQRTSASRVEKPGAYSTPEQPLGGGQTICNTTKSRVGQMCYQSPT
jgi:hypothetical protein